MPLPTITLMYHYHYPRPALTADCVLFGEDPSGLKLLLIQRKNEPYKDFWALPGGFMNMDETIEACAQRELKEETGLEINNLKQLHTFSAPGRDPRGRTVSVVFVGIVEAALFQPEGGDDAAKANWVSAGQLPELAFDHKEIIQMAFDWYFNR